MPPRSARRRVLVTGAGGPSGISFMIAARSDEVEFLAADIDPYAPGLYLVEPERRVLLPRGEDPRFARTVLALCREREIDALVPTVDCELIALACIRSELENAGTKLLLAPEAALHLCLDKWALLWAMDESVPIPRCELDDGSLDRSTWALPAVIKPRSGSGSRGVRVLERWDELDPAPEDERLIQEFLPGREFSLDVLCSQAGEVLAVVPRERLRLDSGIAITSRTLHDPGLERLGRSACELVGMTGVANVQVREDVEGVPRLIEINPRFPGTMPLTVASGINMPKLALGELLGEPIPATRLEFREIAMVRYLAGMVVAAGELADLEATAAAVGAPSW
ncbi:MAG TPA: ATP-grasp domain-containing protein [Solirubrobacteraceae bacterium]